MSNNSHNISTIGRRFLFVVCWIISIHIFALLCLSAVRLLHFAVNAPNGLPIDKVLYAFLLGLKFDNVVMSYITALPLLVLGICSLLKVNLRKPIRIFSIFYSVCVSIVLLVAIADVPYYRFFNNHLNWDALSWLQFFSDTAGMLLGEKSFYIYLPLALLAVALIVFVINRITKSFLRCTPPADFEYHWQPMLYLPAAWLMLCGLCFLGIRGSVQRYPISVGFVAFTDNVFLNRLGVNPTFNILESSKYNVDMPQLIANTDATQALDFVRQTLNIQTENTNPLMRSIEGADTVKHNIIVILMESMTKYNIGQTYNSQPLTPFLNSLYSAPHCISFDNCYSAGIHTNNGITATLFGYAPNFAKTTMPVPPTEYAGLPYNLHQQGYKNIAFVTSNPQYDNMNSALLENDFDRIYSLYDYPAEAAVNNFGVPDDYMFSYGIQTLQSQQQPFMAMFLTVSNHAPFVYPEKFKERGADDMQREIAYADEALREFICEAQQTDWGRDAYFVLVADHGAPIQQLQYEMVYEYNHIVMHILSNNLSEEHYTYSSVASQVDVAPTILSLAGLTYQNNTMGIDLLTQQREMAYFVSNECLGCADDNFFWCYNIQTDKEFLYKIGENDNLLDSLPLQAQTMRRYATNMQRVNTDAVTKGWTKP